MAKRPPTMFYAYFRFYVEEPIIEAGLGEYCTEWEHMYAIGYNYTEYKCFVDNLGGFEHWVGDMRGYISQTREVGFLDASPSDSVYDSTLLMGTSRFDGCDLRYLHYQKPTGAQVVLRKLSALATAEANVNYSFSAEHSISHAFYGAYDETKIEIVNYSGEITSDSVDVNSSTATFDVSTSHGAIPTIDPATTLTDPEKTINGNFSTYAGVSSNTDKFLYLDLGSIKDIYNVCYKYYLHPGSGTSFLGLYYGDTVAGATTLIESDVATSVEKKVDKVDYRDLGISGRFLKFRFLTNNATAIGKLYQVYVS